jgi:hypothetical protein
MNYNSSLDRKSLTSEEMSSDASDGTSESSDGDGDSDSTISGNLYYNNFFPFFL